MWLHALLGIITVQAPETQYYGVKWASDEAMVAHYIHQEAPKYGVDVELALRIAKAESDFNPAAANFNKNGTWDKGIFQINDVHNVPDTCRLNYKCNIDWALETMARVGTQPWYSSEHRWK